MKFNKEYTKELLSKIGSKLKTKKAIAVIIVAGLGIIGVNVPGGEVAVESALTVVLPLLGM